MSGYSFYIFSISAWTVSIAVWYVVGRGVFKAGIEHYSSRILLLSSIINVGLCSILLCMQAAIIFMHAFEFGRIRLPHLIIALSFLILPARSVWNLVMVRKRFIKHFHLEHCDSRNITSSVLSLASTTGIRPPAIVSSTRVAVPFVFGLNSNDTFLAIPDQWEDLACDSRRVMILHELGHIRNRDVGFLTWAFSFVRDLRWLLWIVPLVAVICVFLGAAHMTSMCILYMACLIILYMLFRHVIRKREGLADLTAAMLIQVGKIDETFTDLQYAAPGLHRSASYARARLFRRIGNWLWDKAMFGQSRWFWKGLYIIHDFFASTHPTASSRTNAIINRFESARQSSLGKGECFWAGLSLGLLAVIVSLGGFWWAKYLLGYQTYEDIMLVPYELFLLAGAPAIGFVALLFVLPAWASLQAVAPRRKILVSLLTRYLIGFLGGCSICPLILVEGWMLLEIRALAVLSVIWLIFIFGFGLGANVVLLVLWLQFRYWLREFLVDLVWLLYCCGIGVGLVTACFTLGFVFVLKGNVVVGTNLLVSMILGLLTLSLLIRGSSVSGTDQYAVFKMGPLVYRCQGKNFRWFGPLLGSGSFILLGFVPAGIAFSCLSLFLFFRVNAMDNFLGLVIAAIVGCCVLLLLGWRWSKCITQTRLQKVYTLYSSLRILGTKASSALPGIRSIVNAYFGRSQSSTDLAPKAMTSRQVFAVASLTNNEQCPEAAAGIIRWLEACRTEPGFGPWPGSTTRLSSTYHCLYALQRMNALHVIDDNRLVCWLKSLQRPEGCFRGIWSKRPLWEDTFLAAGSIDILGSALEPDRRESCQLWIRNTLDSHGIRKHRMDVVYYCMGTLDAIKKLDDEITENVANWLLPEIDQLLLSNISHNSENVLCVLRVYDILHKHGKMSLSPEKHTLLVDRIAVALDAELLGILG